MSTDPRTAESKSLDELIEEVWPGVFALCYRLVGSVEDAEDLTQDSVIKMAKAYAGFEGRSAFRTWAYRIATNTCYNFLSSARKRRELVLPDPLETVDEFLAASEPDIDPDELRESLEFSFVCVLQELSPLQRLVVVLRDVLGWSVAQTAETLGSNPAPIKNIHSRARKRLRELKHGHTTMAPSHPLAESFMRDYAKAHVERDLDACMAFYAADSTLYAFPTRKYVGLTEIREYYADMLPMMPTLFVGVKMNGSLGAACYHPTPEGGLMRTGVVIPEIGMPRPGEDRPYIAQVFWAQEPDHHERTNTPAELAEAPKDAQYLL
jgi:RNA polymerase sigma-70 factor (ECF subfamily)